MATARTMSISDSSAEWGQEVLGGLKFAIGAGQALPQPLDALSVVILRHASPSEHLTPPGLSVLRYWAGAKHSTRATKSPANDQDQQG